MNKKMAAWLTCAVMLALAGVARADEAAAPVAQPAAPEREWKATVGMDLWSEYIFRGVDVLNNDPMYNPSASFSWKGITAYYWGAFGDSDAPGSTWYEETDLGVEYAHTFGKVTMTGGALWYIYQDNVSGIDTQELYVKLAYDFPLLLPAVSYYHDIDEFGGGYLTFSLGHSFGLTEALKLSEPMTLSIDVSAALSFDISDYWNTNTPGASDFQTNDVLIGVRVPWNVTDRLNIHAGVQFSFALDAVEDLYGAGTSKDNEIIGNIGVSYAF